MFIVMHCGGMPFNGETIASGQSLGGSESAAYYVARELARRGHKVIMFTNHDKEGMFDGVKYCSAGQVTEAEPLGYRFHFFAQNTPHDVCIVQRHPLAFRHVFASKVNLLWLHDLGLHSQTPYMNSQLWNINYILATSRWHIDQLHSVYGVPGERFILAPNGVDQELYHTRDAVRFKSLSGNGRTNLVYSSRPERGLEHLVREGGIMDRLHEHDPNRYMLHVCMYANFPPHMSGLYEYLFERCRSLPNVNLLDPLSKADLADLQRGADVWCYPSEFEEVSCITAMEAVNAGLSIVASDVGAISETLRGHPATLIPLKDGKADEDAFVECLTSSRLSKTQPHRSFQWGYAVDAIESAIDSSLRESVSSQGAVARHLVRMSDIYAFQEWRKVLTPDSDRIALASADEVDECYRFAFHRDWKAHYQAYYQYEKDRGVNYGPENLDGNTRYEAVAMLLREKNLPEGGVVLDYGCAHGHYTVNLAKRFPHLKFVGIDIEATNVEKARAWAAEEHIENVSFAQATVDELDVPYRPHFIIAAEVLEHLEDASGTVDKLGALLHEDGTLLLTTPVGPWEYIGACEHWPWRAHVHHFERADLHEMYGHHPDFDVKIATSGLTEEAEVLGSYIVTFKKPGKPSGKIDYGRKLKQTVPRQTLALCMIVKNGEEGLLKAINSVYPQVSEIVIGVDATTTDGTVGVIDRLIENRRGPLPLIRYFTIPSPTEIGFDEARNMVIENVDSDWILWLDADEHVEGAANLMKYLRASMYNGFAVDHHHLSVDPPGLLRTDKPTRVFRNHKGIRFFGVVHEHPEVEINKGVGPAVFIPDVKISHVGYRTESVRKGRFMRNIGLMERDREKYPERILGKFLWVRDLSMMNRFEMEQNGGHVTDDIVSRSYHGMDLYEELMDIADERMLIDGMEYYSQLCAVVGGIEMSLDLNMSQDLGTMGDAPKYRGVFRNVEVSRKFIDRVFKERTKNYGNKYL